MKHLFFLHFSFPQPAAAIQAAQTRDLAIDCIKQLHWETRTHI